MALPSDVSTFTLHFGAYTDAQGLAALVASGGKLFFVDPSTNRKIRLTHVTSGQVIVPDPVSITIASDGTGSVGPIPHTGQAAFSPQGAALRVEWNIASNKPSPGNLTFVVPSGATADFDLLVPADTVPAVAISQPSVSVVGGVAGNTTAQQLVDALATPLGVYATDAELTAGLATKVNSSTYTAGLATKQDVATLAAATAPHVTDGSALDVALRAAFGRAPKPSGGNDSAALIAAADALPGGKGVLVLEPNSTYIAQGLPVRDGLTWWGYGATITLPAAPTTSMFKTTGQALVQSGGIYGLTLLGNGGTKGAGATQRGVDCESLDRLDRYDVHDCHVEGFTVGVHGSENGGVGNDRWLHVQGCRIHHNLIGLKGNEHPIIVSCDFRENTVALTGRINDMNCGDTKFAYNTIGVEPEAGRGTVDNCTFTGCLWYRNGVGIRLGHKNLIQSSAFDGTGAAGSIGVQFLGLYNVVTGFRANQASSTECDTTFQLVSGASNNTISDGYVRQWTAGRRVVGFLDASITGLKATDITMTLDAGSHGIYSETYYIVRGEIRGIRASLSGDGRVLSVPQFHYAKVTDNHVVVSGATLTAAALNIPNNGNLGCQVTDNTVIGISGATGVGLSVDARKGLVADNAVYGALTMALANSDADSVIGNNVGMKTKANGIATVPSGATSIQVTHGLGRTPTAKDIAVTPVNNLGLATKFWVSGVTSTIFLIVVNVDPGADTAKFAWAADIV